MQSTLRPDQLVRSLLDWTASFNHLVGACEQRCRDVQAERPSSLGVDHQLELDRLHHRQVRRLSALEDSTGVDTDLTPRIRKVAPVAYQPANFGKLAPRIRNGDPVMRRQVDQLDTPAGEEGVDVNEKGIGPLAHTSCESHIDLAASAGVEDLNFQPDCASSRLRVSQRALGIGAGRVDEHANASGCGYQLTYEFQPLRRQLSTEKIDSRQVAARPS